MVLVLTAGFVAVAFGVWSMWPTLRKQAQTVLTRFTGESAKSKPSENQAQTRRPTTSRPTGAPAATAKIDSELRQRNLQLLNENQRLREQLEETSRTLARKEEELNELKLQLLIRQKTRD
jgi:hypothetical protein